MNRPLDPREVEFIPADEITYIKELLMKKNYKKFIVVRSRFQGVHSWPGCPHEEVAFLRHPHRHEFHVEVKLQVGHSDRDLEFFMVKNMLDGIILAEFLGEDLNTSILNLGSRSCEMIAEELIAKLTEALGFPLQDTPLIYVSVFEDGENGAVVEVS